MLCWLSLFWQSRWLCLTGLSRHWKNNFFTGFSWKIKKIMQHFEKPGVQQLGKLYLWYFCTVFRILSPVMIYCSVYQVTFLPHIHQLPEAGAALLLRANHGHKL
jgi:hypothetical protein